MFRASPLPAEEGRGDVERPDRRELQADSSGPQLAEPASLLPEETLAKYEGDLDDIPGIFEKMGPMPGAIEAYRELSQLFDTYILSTAPWDNPPAWTHKVDWVRKHLGEDPDSPAYKRLILTHHKNLSTGDFLVDDRTKNGADRFPGEHIHFGTEAFPDWETVVGYLRDRAA